MPNDGSGLVVDDPQRMGTVRRPVVRPSEISTDNVFGTLQPLETDDRGGGWLGASSLNCAPSEFVDLFSRGGRFGFHRPAFLRRALPWIWYDPIEQLGVEPMHDAPGVTTH